MDRQQQINQMMQQYNQRANAGGTSMATPDPNQVSNVLDQLGFSNQMYGQYNPTFDQGTMDMQQQAPSDGGGNFLTNNLSTGGSILGGVLGSFGGPIGTVIGAGVGSGAGKLLENLLEKGEVGAGDVAKEAALGAGLTYVGGKAMQGVGKVGRKVLGKGAEAVTKKVGPKVFGKAAEQAVVKEPSMAGRYGSRFLQGAFNNQIDENTARNLYLKYGITRPEQAVGIKDIVTGSADSGPGQALLNKVVENTVAKSGAMFDPTDLAAGLLRTGGTVRSGTLAEKIINSVPAGSISEATEKKLYNEFASTVQKLLGAQVGNQQAASIEGLKTARVFAQKAAQASANSGRNPELGYVAKIYQQFADELTDKALSPMGKDILINQADKAALLDELVPLVQRFNPRAAEALAKDVAEANTLRDLRSIQSLWVNAGNAAEATAAQQGAKAGITSSGLGEAFSTPVRSTGRAAGSFLGRRLDTAMPRTLQVASDVATKAGLTNPEAMRRVGGPLAVGLGTSILNYQPVGATGMTPDVLSSLAGAGGAGAMGAGAPGMAGQAPGMGGAETQGPSDYQKAMMSMALFNPTLMGAMTMTPEQRQGSQNAIQAINSLNSFTDAFVKAGGGQGPIGGAITKLKGTVGGGAGRTYQQEKQRLAITIAPVLGVAPAEVDSMLPDVTDSPDQAAGKIASIKRQLQTTLQASQQTGLAGLGFSGSGGTPSLLSGLMR